MVACATHHVVDLARLFLRGTRFLVAPYIYGQNAIIFSMLLPFGIPSSWEDSSYTFGIIIYRAIRKPTKIPLTVLVLAIQKPCRGWEADRRWYRKSFHFLKTRSACGLPTHAV